MLSVTIVALLCALRAGASDLQRGISFTDGNVLHAADLDNLIDLTTVAPALITGKPQNLSPYGTDLLLSYSPTLSGFYKVPFASLGTVGTNGIIPYTLTTNDLFGAFSFGSNTNNPTGTNTNPQNVTTPYAQLMNQPWQIYPSPVTNGNYWANGGTRYTNGPYSVLLVLNITLQITNVTAGGAAAIFVKDLSQTNFAYGTNGWANGMTTNLPIQYSVELTYSSSTTYGPLYTAAS